MRDVVDEQEEGSGRSGEDGKLDVIPGDKAQELDGVDEAGYKTVVSIVADTSFCCQCNSPQSTTAGAERTGAKELGKFECILGPQSVPERMSISVAGTSQAGPFPRVSAAPGSHRRV